jgi:hypothetical protein
MRRVLRFAPLFALFAACDGAPAQGAEASPAPAARPAGAPANPLADALDQQRAEAERAQIELAKAQAEVERERAALEMEQRRDGATKPGAPPPAGDVPQRYRPRLLDEAPAKASIAPGEYRCKISREYKLRPCTVRVDDGGHTILSMPDALIALEGVVYDEDDVLHFDGWPTEERPFGCFSCAPHCAVNPTSCACVELQPAASAHCIAQPIAFDLRRRGDGWAGTMRYATYSNRYEGDVPARRSTGYTFEVDELIVEVRPVKGER